MNLQSMVLKILTTKKVDMNKVRRRRARQRRRRQAREALAMKFELFVVESSYKKSLYNDDLKSEFPDNLPSLLSPGPTKAMRHPNFPSDDPIKYQIANVQVHKERFTGKIQQNIKIVHVVSHIHDYNYS